MIRRMTLAFVLGLALATVALPQEDRGKVEPKHEGGEGDPWILWKWLNFAILVGGLGFLVRKNAPAFFTQRTREIQQAMLEAAKVKKDAETQAAQIELRLSALQNEIENLRSAARDEMTAEGERILRETEQRLGKIQDQSAQEIALMSRAARQQLRKYSAQLALDLAGQRIRSRMTSDAQNGLVDAFLQDLRYRVTPDART